MHVLTWMQIGAHPMQQQQQQPQLSEAGKCIGVPDVKPPGPAGEVAKPSHAVRLLSAEATRHRATRAC